MNGQSRSTAGDHEERRRWPGATDRRGVTVAAMLLGLFALAGCGGPSLNSPEGLEQEEEIKEQEQENRRG